MRLDGGRSLRVGVALVLHRQPGLVGDRREERLAGGERAGEQQDVVVGRERAGEQVGVRIGDAPNDERAAGGRWVAGRSRGGRTDAEDQDRDAGPDEPRAVPEGGEGLGRHVAFPRAVAGVTEGAGD